MTIRAVIDPGVLVSALLSRSGIPAKILDRFRHQAFELVSSDKLMAELDEVLNRPKFNRIAATDRDEVFYVLRAGGIIWPDPMTSGQLTEDVDGDYLAALAEDCGADYLVTGDRALRRWTSIRVAVLTPRDFLERVQGS